MESIRLFKIFFVSGILLCQTFLFLPDLMGQADSVVEAQVEEKLNRLYKAYGSGIYDKALDSSLHIADISKQHELWVSYLTARFVEARIYRDVGDHVLAFQAAETLLEEAEQYLGINHPIYSACLNFWGVVLDKKKEYPRAIRLFRQALANDSLSLPEQAAFNMNIGKSYRAMGDYDEAIRYYQTSDRIHEVYKDTLVQEGRPLSLNMIRNLATSYRNMAWLYRTRKEYPQAIRYFETHQKMYTDLDADNFWKNLATGAYGFADIYLEMGDLAKATKAMQDVEKYLSGRSYKPEFLAYFKGLLALRQGQYIEAIPLLEEGFKQINPSLTTAESAIKMALALAEAYEKNNQLEEALVSLQNGYDLVTQGFEWEDPAQNPEISQFIFTKDAFPLVAAKAALLARMAGDCDLEGLNKSLETYQLASELIFETRRSFLAEGSKLFLSQLSIPVYEEAIALCNRMHTCKNDNQYLDKAFSFAESGKAVLLYEALKESEAKDQLSIPEALRQREREIKANLSLYREQIFNKSNNPKGYDSTRVEQWRAEVFKLENEYQELIKELEGKYPDYYEAKYQFSIPSVSQIQSFLKHNQHLVEFFWGDAALFVFSIQKSEIQIHQISLEANWEQELRDLLGILSSRRLATQQGQDLSRFKQFSALATKIYQDLLGPIQIKPEETLLIVPDGLLGYLPFGALLHLPPQNTDQVNYYELPYLLRQNSIQYQYSASLLLSGSRKRNNAQMSYGGFAPVYGDSLMISSNPSRGDTASRQGLAPLLHTAEEIRKIQELVGGEVMVGDEAAKARFLEKAAQYRILHLAMHTLTYDENPAYSALVFNPILDTGTTNYLTAFEIANMDLNAEMAVLSACNTGIGKLQRGEGIMSLARAFRKAGCPNVAMSLWQADDKATGTIMEQFYRHLMEGKDKSEALRMAKLEFLSQTDVQSHPHFWSAFVIVGDPGPLDRSGSRWIFWFAIGIGILGSLFWWLHSQRNQAA